MLWTIDQGGAEPVYLQLAGQVHSALAKGELKGGERLPTARELAEALDLNMHTVLHAYQKLRDDGVIELRRGRGAVIVQNAGHNNDAVRKALTQFATAAKTAGLSTDAALTLLKMEMSQ